MKKFALFDAKPYDIEAFEKHIEGSGIEIKYLESKLNADTCSLAQGCDGVCVFVNDTVDKEVIDKLYSMGIKLIALRCAGFNNVDIKAAFGKIHVVRVPAYSPYAVAEHAMAMLLTSVRRIHKAYNRTRDFNFSLTGLMGFDMHDKTVGIIGTGKIGRVFADICRGFGMNILCYDKFPSADAGLNYTDLDTLFKESDVISFHCPLTEDTYHIVNEKSIQKMKKGVVLINTSRGALIDSAALLEAIKARHIGAACLDVYEEESDIFFEDYSGHIVEDDTLARLMTMPNVLVTSHQAFLTTEALSNIAQTTIDNINTFFEKDECENEICYRCENAAECKKQRKKKCF